LTVHDADARPFLRSTDDRYDLIVVDAYHQPYVRSTSRPAFFRLARERLAPGHRRAERRRGAGRQASRGGGRAHGRCGAAAVLEWPALRFNTIARPHDPLAPAELDRRLRSGPTDLAPLRELLARDVPLDRPGAVDRRPGSRRVGDRPDDLAYAAEGGRLDEDSSDAAGRAVISLERRDAAAADRPSRRGRPAPENTLRAFRAALEAGVDLVELDVLDLRDGSLVVAHSYDLFEASHGAHRGSFREWGSTMSAPPARAADARGRARVLRRRGASVGVHVDLKSAAAAAASPRARSLGLRERSLVSSFDVRRLRRFAAHEPGVRIGISFLRTGPGCRGGEDCARDRGKPEGLARVTPRLVGRLLSRAARPRSSSTTRREPAAVRAAHARGAVVVAWTGIDRRPARVDAAGVDAVVVDDPTIFASTLQT
jgi:glycerophosphoryl diester phosphodiesterase